MSKMMKIQRNHRELSKYYQDNIGQSFVYVDRRTVTVPSAKYIYWLEGQVAIFRRLTAPFRWVNDFIDQANKLSKGESHE